MIRELDIGETHLAFEAMLHLRPQVGDALTFTSLVDGGQRRDGYRLVASFADSEGQAAAVAGFRIHRTLAWGKILYCDDLSSRPEFRRQGHASRLVQWLIDEAKRNGCDQFHLDSGVGPHRQDAHRLYMNSGMRITAHHFALELT